MQSNFVTPGYNQLKEDFSEVTQGGKVKDLSLMGVIEGKTHSRS